MSDNFKQGRFTQKDSAIVFYAFRYCLGRCSYAVSDFCEYATAYIRHIWTYDLELMGKEITDADEKDKEDATTTRFCSRLGWDCDRADWLKLRDAIRKELERRKEPEVFIQAIREGLKRRGENDKRGVENR